MLLVVLLAAAAMDVDLAVLALGDEGAAGALAFALAAVLLAVDRDRPPVLDVRRELDFDEPGDFDELDDGAGADASAFVAGG